MLQPLPNKITTKIHNIEITIKSINKNIKIKQEKLKQAKQRITFPFLPLDTITT